MNEVAIFAIGIGITLVASFLVVMYLRPHLHTILIDLCGTEDRASFWTAFSIVVLMLVPVIATMSIRPTAGQDIAIVYMLSDQIQGGLIGLAGSVIIIGLILSRFILPIRPPNAGSMVQSGQQRNAV